MNKLIIIFIGMLLISCNQDFLDQVPDDRLTFEETFSKRTTLEQYLANIYSAVPNEFNQRYSEENSGPWRGASDDAEYVWGFHLGNDLNLGSWDPTTQYVSTLWSNFYRAIRKSSTFLNNVDKCTDLSEDLTIQYKAEVRILRAYFYYNLLRTYGPVILMGEDPIDVDADLASLGLERDKMEDVVKYIVDELDKGAASLKGVSFRDGNAGRMSRPFALAIKEKTLLFAASPLFNGNTMLADLKNSDNENLVPQTYDVNLWKDAADAAKSFIDEYVPATFKLYKEYNDDGSLNPYLSTRNVMTEEWNEEMIYARPRGGHAYFYDVTPYHSGEAGEVRGAGGLSVTQGMVDAYFTENGRSIDDPLSNYQETGFSNYMSPCDIQQRSTFNQWVNREPRFYVGVTYNGSLWLCRTYGDIITKTWYGGNSGRQVGTNDYPPTGYVVRKNMITESRHNTDRSIPGIRLAEIYLDYVEALNEYNPGNADILIYLNKIRERAGIPGYGEVGLEIPASQEDMRIAIRKERHVELAFESIRYFDVRRWLIAEEKLGGPKYGMDINATEESNFYNKVVFETRIFEQRHYLWPIPQDEIDSNPNLIQNSGWSAIN
ncbi:MAG: RagB/SusD family nutrient uptake outer membrane protein [Labilibaculum sp.]|nr:RagB/SusD family nutrient uptake outer membrane protein [Labilibaculum sp.]